MKRGALVNLLIGITIALLPLYNRVAALDFNRTSKDNLLVFIFGFLGFLLPGSIRRMSSWMYFVLIYALFFLVFNQWNVLSINVMFHGFYILSGLIFFVHFYEKYDRKSTHFILYGMIAGSLIQSTIAIAGYFGVDLYPEFFKLFSHIDVVGRAGSGKVNTIGSLGNSNLLASYIALTSLAFLHLKNKWMIVIPVFALILSGSIISIVSFCAGVFYYLNFTRTYLKKWQIYFLSVLPMVALCFTHIHNSGSGRFVIWKESLSRVDLHHFLIGKGAGWFPDQQIIYNNSTVVQEHNSFLSFFNVFGIAGLLIIFPIFWKFIHSQDQNRIFSSVLFVAWCNSYGHFTLHQSTTAIIIIVTAAICLVEGKNNVISLER